jgi:hypothetical protein
LYRTAHDDRTSVRIPGGSPVMTELQGWFLVIEVGVLALLAIVGRWHA